MTLWHDLEEKKGSRIPGWGGITQQAWRRPVLPAHLPVTQHMGRNWLNAETVEWSESSPPGGTARLEIGTPRRRPPLSSGPASVWRQPSLSADLRGRQRAAQSFWSSGCGPRKCAMLLWDTANAKAGSASSEGSACRFTPPDRGRVWWEPWARIQAGFSRQHENRPARTQGTLRLPKTPGCPRPVWWKWARSGPPARYSRLPGQAWPSALSPHLHPQRMWTHPPMLRSTSCLQMALRMKCWAPRGTDQRNHLGTGSLREE